MTIQFHHLIRESDPQWLETDPWLQFGYAYSLQYSDWDQFRAYLDKALAIFQRDGNEYGQTLAIRTKITIDMMYMPERRKYQELLDAFAATAPTTSKSDHEGI